jgi:hypothetical protein
MINLGEKNIKQLDNEITQLINVINESNTELTLIIDIKYLINFLNNFKKVNQQIHLFDLILHKLYNCPINNILIYDENNLYQSNNLLYTQIEVVLLKNNDFDLEKKLTFYKKISDPEYNIYWNILTNSDLNSNYVIEYDKELKTESTNSPNEKFLIGKINLQEVYICDTTIKNIIYKNIFNLDLDPGITIDPFDKINCLF